MKKRLAELTALRFKILLLLAAIFIALGYIAYAIFKFNRIAGSIINNYQPEPDEEEEESDDDDKNANENRKDESGKSEPGTATAAA